MKPKGGKIKRIRIKPNWKFSSSWMSTKNKLGNWNATKCRYLRCVSLIFPTYTTLLARAIEKLLSFDVNVIPF